MACLASIVRVMSTIMGRLGVKSAIMDRLAVKSAIKGRLAVKSAIRGWLNAVESNTLRIYKNMRLSSNRKNY